jgi:hypothetical protein
MARKCPGHVLGPIGGGPMRHEFFKDIDAPLGFTSVGALEHYIERVRSNFDVFELPK